jgi:hypothetical protein
MPVAAAHFRSDDALFAISLRPAPPATADSSPTISSGGSWQDHTSTVVMMADLRRISSAPSVDRDGRKPPIVGRSFLGARRRPLPVWDRFRAITPWTALRRVEMWRGDFRCEHIRFRPFRLAVPYEFARGSVSTPRSSNRTCRATASGSRTRHHAFAHDWLRPRAVRRTSP